MVLFLRNSWQETLSFVPVACSLLKEKKEEEEAKKSSRLGLMELGWSSAAAKAHAPLPKMDAHHTYYFARTKPNSKLHGFMSIR